MKKFIIGLSLFASAFLTSCGVKKEGLVIMTDQSYKATMFKIAFVIPNASA